MRQRQRWVVFWESDIGLHERETITTTSAKRACDIAHDNCCGYFYGIRHRMFAVPIEKADEYRKRSDYRGRRTSALMPKLRKNKSTMPLFDALK